MHYDYDYQLSDAEQARLIAQAEARTNLAEYNNASVKKQLMIEQALMLHNIEAFTSIGARTSTFKKTMNLAGSPAGLLNKLLITPGVGDFIQMKPHEISELVPMIRIFKTLYKGDGTIDKEIEFKFPMSNLIKTANGGIENILSDTTDGGVGIKSFEYKFIGSNPATVRNDIEAKLVLYFQNFSEMLRPRYSAGGTEYRYIDLFDRSRKLKNTPFVASYDAVSDPDDFVQPTSTSNDSINFDELGQHAQADYSACTTDSVTPSRREYNPIEFERKAAVGWAWSDAVGSTITSSATRQAIKNSAQSFFLTLIDHDFSFEDDGTFTLELNYRARLSGVMASNRSDILNLQSTEHLYNSGYVKTKVGSNFLWIDWGNNDVETVNTVMGTWAQIWAAYEGQIRELEGCCDREEDLKALKASFNDFKAQVRGRKFRQFLQALIDGNRIYSFTATPEIVAGMTGTRVGPDSESGPNAAAATITAAMLQSGIVADVGATESGQMTVEGQQTTFETNEDWKDAMADPATITSMAGIPVAYMFFGDIVDMAATMVMNEELSGDPNSSDYVNPEVLKRMKLLLGSIEMEKNSGDSITVPLCDIPISVSNFRQFWYNKVIAPQKDKYAFLHFVRDMVRELIVNSINSSYYSFSPKTMRQKLKFMSATISLPKAGEVTTQDWSNAIVGLDDPGTSYENIEDDPTYWGMPVNESIPQDYTTTDPLEAWMIANNTWGNKKVIDMDAIKMHAPVVTLNPYLRIDEMYHYLVVYVENGSMNYMKKSNIPYGKTRRENDWENGIYHFGFGEDRGILRTAKFNKTQQPFLREARYMEDGYNPMQQLSSVYDVDLNLFGAPFFYPGQYFWINPYGLSKGRHSLGAPDAGPVGSGASYDFSNASYAHIMGLGGYHIIIEVHGILEDGKYHTNIKARFDNSGADFGERQGFGMRGESNTCGSDNE